MRALGVDPSATHTGIVVLEGPPLVGPVRGHIPKLLHEQVVTSKLRGLDRASEIAGHMLHVIDLYQPEAVAIEGYGGGKFKGSLIILVEVGTVLRYFLRQLGLRYLEPAPTQVKKFVLGSQGEKSQIMLAVYKRWGHEAKDDNTADAYVMAAMALAHRGRLGGLTNEMREVLGLLTLH